jgi:hypothetical protein
MYRYLVLGLLEDAFTAAGNISVAAEVEVTKLFFSAKIS